MNLQLKFLVISLFSVAYSDKFRFASHYADHMVLQRGPRSVMIWGFGENESLVVVSIVDEKYEAKVTTDSRGLSIWKVIFKPIYTQGPYQIDAESSVDGKKVKLSLKDVLFGDVWLCGGQSNMQFTAGMAFKGVDEIEIASKYPHIRLFTVERYLSHKPVAELNPTKIKQQWSVANKDSVGGRAWQYFSAVCWMFGRRLYDIYKVPIGLISSNYGGTPVEAWSSPETLAKCGLPLEGPHFPSVLWNGMIAPLLNTTIYGVIWYQGEANALHPQNYNCTFPAMIDGWRREWYEGTSGQTDIYFPFGFVQLSSLSNKVPGFPEIRWKQTAEYGYVPNPKQINTFMAVALDLIDSTSPFGSIHPRDKTTVAKRLVLGARAIAYKEDIYWTGPIFEGVELKHNDDKSLNIIVHYKPSILNGIELRSDGGFEVTFRNETNKWMPVSIVSSSENSLLLTLQGISGDMLKGIRYAWNQNPCLYKLCAVYALDSDLPSPPFIAYAPFQKENERNDQSPIVRFDGETNHE